MAIHQIMDLAFFELSSSSIFAFIKASLLSIPFFIEVRTTNPIIMKPIVIQSNKSTFYTSLFCELLSFQSSLFIQIGKPLKLSPAFPPVHTVHATFTAYGVPTNPIQLIINTSDIKIPSMSQFFRFNKSVPPLEGEPLLVSREPY